MTKFVFILAVLLITINVKAQTWDEWFNQKKTGIKYLVEQVAALKMYGSAVKKGYDIVNGGLKNIGHLKESDLILHQEHVASLMNVRPGVKASAVIQRIYSLQVAIQRVYSDCKTFLRKGTFSSAEKDYFQTVQTNVLNQCRAAGEETILLVSDGRYQMSDDERLKRLLAICSNIEEQYEFIRHFRNEMVTTAINRLKEQKEVKVLKSLY